MPTEAEILELHKKYATDDKELESITQHCAIVAEIALWCANNIKEPVNKELLKTACLLHDIGSYPFMACLELGGGYKKMYSQHALLGAKIVEDEGLDKSIWSLIETHTVLGFSKEEIIENNYALPAHDYRPTTIEGRLLCYADRFHSKFPDSRLNSYEVYMDLLKTKMPKQAQKFADWSKEFGVPDLDALAKKYNQPIR